MSSFAALLLITQLVSVCPKGDCPQQNCLSEKIAPNLQIFVASAAVTGTVRDVTGAPLAHKQLQIRDVKSEKKLASTVTDPNGHFALTLLKKGKYRLLVFTKRLFKQPVRLECFSENCELSLTLAASPSDQEYMFCPER